MTHLNPSLLRKSHYVRKLRLLNCSWGETMFFDVTVGVLRLPPCSCYFITVLNYFLRLYLDSLNKRGLQNQPTRSRRSYRAWIRRRPNTWSRTRRGNRSLPSVYWTSSCHIPTNKTMTWSKENNMSCSPKICKELTFRRKGNNSSYNPVFAIPQCSSLVLLGVAIQSDCKFWALVNLKLIKANKYMKSDAMRPNALCHQWRVFVSYGQKCNMFAFHPCHISFGLENG